MNTIQGQYSLTNAVNQAWREVQNNADAIAKAPISNKTPPTTELIQIKQSEISFGAVAKTVKTYDDIMGTLLDIKT